MEIILAADLLSPNAGLIFWKTLVFGLLLFLLHKFAWKPITTALNAREETIDSSIKRAEQALAEARKIQQENDRARRESEAEAQRVLREAREAADRVRNEEIEKTRDQIRQMKEHAEAAIENEKQGALNELRDEVAEMAIQAAEKILKETLDAGRQRKLVDQFIDELPRN
jgi:F-type H+-transporting ATPase subunit b